ncbi:MAG TPA: LLM class flavin-dependent oxidoreductase [Nitrososphaera sp.]|nr:LLM class flavin-dependent oxidoreductase [Nitrososphaera sp.]
MSSSSDQYREPSVSKVIKSTSKVEAGSKRIRNRSNMQVGIDSFAAAFGGESASLTVISPSERLQNLVEQIEYADQVGLDIFGVGEHHRQEFLDSAPAVILAAAAARTQRIRLTSAVTVLSAADPVRVFQEFATLDLLSQGRAEMIVGRGSSIEAFPLFGLRLEDYDSLFAEKLNLLLKVRDNEHIHWSGEYRPPLTGQGIYPRPLQNPFPIWLGVGGTPQSFVRAGVLGLPLMVAIIGGETRRFRPFIDLYREAGRQAGHSPDQLKVGVHSPGYVAETTQEAVDDFFPGYAHTMNKFGKERGWRPITRADLDAQRGPQGALLVGDPDEVVRKIVRHSKALGGGISRITFQMDPGSLSQEKLMRAIKLIGTRVVPALREELDIDESEKEEFNKIPNA